MATVASGDLVFANSGSQNRQNRLCVALEAGGFTCSDVSNAENFTFGLAAADLDGDADNDLVFANLDASTANTVCRNDGDKQFTCSSPFDPSPLSVDVAAADLDGDGDLDLAFANSNQRNRVCLNSGSLTFSCSDVSTDELNSNGVVAADFDGDMDVDLAFANARQSGVFFEQRQNRVCLNDGSAGFTCSDIVPNSNLISSSAVAVDLDGDLDPDLVFSNRGPNSYCLNDGSAGFACSQVSTDDKVSQDVAVADLDGDSDPDLVFANETLPSAVCLNDGTQNFSCSDVDISLGASAAFGVQAADVDADAAPDLVFARQNARNRVCMNDGSAGFTCSDVSDDENTTKEVVVAPIVTTGGGEVGAPTLTLVKKVTNDDGGQAVPNDWDLSASGTEAGFTESTPASSDGTAHDVAAGVTYELGESGPSGYSAGSWSCDGGSQSGANIMLSPGDDVTCTITNDDEPATLTVIKTVEGASSTFQFSTTGSDSDLPSSFSLTPTATSPSARTVFSPLAAGSYSITEIVTSGYALAELRCWETGNQNNAVGSVSGRTVSLSLAPGDDVTCSFTNQDQGALTTRMQGFWSTHMELTGAVWFGGSVGDHTFSGVSDHALCRGASRVKDLATLGKVMGGFWSRIASTSDGHRRSRIDRSRMRLVQQLLAAILNNAAFGSSPGGSISIRDATDAYCGTDESTIKDAASAMAAFNESGDSAPFTPGTSANAEEARAAANIPYWDDLP